MHTDTGPDPEGTAAARASHCRVAWAEQHEQSQHEAADPSNASVGAVISASHFHECSVHTKMFFFLNPPQAIKLWSRLISCHISCLKPELACADTEETYNFFTCTWWPLVFHAAWRQRAAGPGCTAPTASSHSAALLGWVRNQRSPEGSTDPAVTHVPQAALFQC